MPDKHSTLSFTLADLDQWVEKGLITPEQLRGIRQQIEAVGPVAGQAQGPEQRKGLNLISVAYYFGAFMILLAYTIFMGLQWEALGTSGQVVVSTLSVAVLWALGYVLRRSGFRVAGGLLIFAGTGVVPLFFYSAQRAVGLWLPDDYSYRSFYETVSLYWVLMEFSSLIVATIVLLLARFPLITLLIAFWTWYLSLDLSRMIFGTRAYEWSETQQIVGLVVGAGLLALGFGLQRRTRQDYSLWFYLFGHLLVLAHLSYFTIDQQGLLGLVYLAVYLAFVVASVWLQRRIFLVFGALGCYGYVSYLAFQVFSGGLGFVFALAAVGLVIVLTAVGYQKYARRWLARALGQVQPAQP